MKLCSRKVNQFDNIFSATDSVLKKISQYIIKELKLIYLRILNCKN